MERPYIKAQGGYGAHLHIELRDGDTGKGDILSPACVSADAFVRRQCSHYRETCY
ncbi:MAG: hypothetical protein ACLSE6_03465 [Alphaproteobacteria bacterium]